METYRTYYRRWNCRTRYPSNIAMIPRLKELGCKISYIGSSMYGKKAH